MCPYHSEVTDISLAAGDPSAGYNAMASHAWTSQHCQGGEYEGDRCKFKPAMTTQSFWDEKADKAQQRREERELQAEQDATLTQVPEVETPEEPVAEIPSVQDVPVEHNEPSAIGEGVEEAPVETAVPMAMAASTKTADDNLGGKGTAVPKMDKRRWTPKTVPSLTGVDDPDGRHPTKRKDVVDPITQTPDEPDNKGELKEIGEQVTEHQDVAKEYSLSISDQGGTFDGGDRSAVSSLLSPEDVAAALAKTKRD
jgi:hypothetical protein